MDGIEREDGFSLIEVMIAMGVLTAGVFGLVGVFAMGVQRSSTSTPMLIAREKAREAVESVHAARDAAELSWSTVQNTSTAPGVFLTGPQAIKMPGNDGLVNTADDGAVETMRKPGYDGILNNADDEIVTLGFDLFKRTITIAPMNLDGTATLNPNLRQVTVTVQYRTDSVWRTYSLVTYVSSYS
jgi:hypothetical protein